LPHNMMTELLRINLLAKNGRHVHKWLEFLESYSTGDRPIERTIKLIIALRPKTQITYCKPTPSKSSKAAATSSRDDVVPSSFVCKR
jgi:transposase